MSATAYIGVGSNLSPYENIEKALWLLMQKEKEISSSTFYRTEAIGEDGLPSWRPEYVNGVFQITTERTAAELVTTVLRPLETILGRVRGTDKYADRPVDLDLLLYGDNPVVVDGKQIPDEDIFVRPFVAVPLLELTGNIEISKGDNGGTVWLQQIVEKMDTAKMELDESFSRRLLERIGA